MGALEDFRSVLGTLEALATTDEVAELLRANNITGKRMDPEACPIARLVTAKTGGITSVGIWSLRWWENGAGQFTRFNLPAPVTAFIRAFDGKVYPELIES